MPKPPITGIQTGRPDQQLWEDGGRHDYGPCDVGYHFRALGMVMFWCRPGSWVMTRRVGFDWGPSDWSPESGSRPRLIPAKHEA